MPEKVNISDLKFESYSDKPIKVFSQMIADPNSALGLGSMASEAAGNAAALALLAVNETKSDDAAMQAAAKDLETLRTYFVHLMDEENKAKSPLEKRLKFDSPEEEIEGGVRTACVIVDEVLYSAIKVVEILNSVADKLCPCTGHIAAASLFFTRAALDTARVQLAWRSTQMIEEVYARTTRREPEIAIEGITSTIDALLEKFEANIK